MYMRKENLEYFYNIQFFRPKATKHVIKSDFLNIFWLFTNPALKILRRPGEKVISFDLMHEYTATSDGF